MVSALQLFFNPQHLPDLFVGFFCIAVLYVVGNMPASAIMLYACVRACIRAPFSSAWVSP